MTRTLHLGIFVGAFATRAVPVPVEASPPPFVFPDGCCYYEGEIVRTVVPPAANPAEGRDDFWAVVGGVVDQKAVVAVAPGDVGYHGGQWRFHVAMWNDGVEPYLLPSAEAVLDAAAAGDVRIERDPARDFKCPIQG